MQGLFNMSEPCGTLVASVGVPARPWRRRTILRAGATPPGAWGEYWRLCSDHRACDQPRTAFDAGLTPVPNYSTSSDRTQLVPGPRAQSDALPLYSTGGGQVQTGPENHASAGAGFSAIISGGLAGLLGNLFTKLLVPDGSGPTAWPWIIAAIFFAISGAVAWRYSMIFGYGAFEKNSQQRRRYNKLRYDLSADGQISIVYERMLRSTLDGIDWLFGDKGQQSNVVGGFFRLRERAPLWTAQSYDRCLLLALMYPGLVVISVWAGSGHVGPAERALHLPTDANGLQRGIILAASFVMILSFLQFMRQREFRNHVRWFVATFLAMSVFIAFVYPGLATIAIALVLSFAFAFAVAAVVSITRADALRGAGGGTLAFATAGAFAIAIAGSQFAITQGIFAYSAGLAAAAILAFVFAAGVALTLHASRKRGWLGIVLLIWSALVFLSALVSPAWMAGLSSWPFAGAVLLFLVILTTLNAPFDWLSLGLTRALLRKGLELGGWWPLVVGLLDLLAAAAVVAMLSVVTLLSVQFFEQLTLWAGGEPIVKVKDILAALADPRRRLAPEFWWIYAMLFSTLLPSVLNVSLGTLSLLRGVPGLRRQLARRMPIGKSVLASERLWMAPVLATQVMLSGVAGLAAMVGLLWVVLIWELPFLGRNLVSLLQTMANADLPLSVLRWLGVN